MSNRDTNPSDRDVYPSNRDIYSSNRATNHLFNKTIKRIHQTGDIRQTNIGPSNGNTEAVKQKIARQTDLRSPSNGYAFPFDINVKGERNPSNRNSSTGNPSNKTRIRQTNSIGIPVTDC